MSESPALTFPFPRAASIFHPTQTLLEAQKNEPVTRFQTADGRSGWVVTRYQDVRTVLVDPRFSRAEANRRTDLPDTGLGQATAGSILGMDPPEHTRLRRLVMGAFTNRRVEALRPRTAEIVRELLDELTALPQPVDLVEHFSLPLPVNVICELLGVPAEDRHSFHEWSDAILGDVSADPASIMAGFEALNAYFHQLIARKRENPADDLMTALIEARDEHDRLDEDELVRLCQTVLVAGHETTANMINLFLLTLHENPDQLALLEKQPETIPQAVEELMRYCQLGETSGLIRVATEDVELSGVRIPAGSAVLPVMAVANRDPSLFAEPDRLDVTRPAGTHLGFGAGVHHCLGAQLARMELQEALRGLLARLPGLTVDVPVEELRFKEGMIVRSLHALPVRW